MPNREQRYEKVLEGWAKRWKDEHLTPQVRTLIAQANFDLYQGPINDGAVGDHAENDEELKKYPGFVTATRTIAQALTDLPSDLYLNTEMDEVLDHEPEWEKCEECKGEGHLIDAEGNQERCELCVGKGGFEPAGDWWHVEASDIRKAIVGGELSEYVR